MHTVARMNLNLSIVYTTNICCAVCMELDIRRETARLVFDDLVLAGVHPQEVTE